MSASRDPLGVLLLSNAMHQPMYAPRFREHPRLKIVAVADEPGQEEYVVGRNRAMATEFGVPYVEDVAEALVRPDVQIVSVCAPIERRGRLSVQVARAGKHLWLDKPPAASRAEAAALRAALDESGRRSQVVSYLGRGDVQEARRAIRDGVIGEVVAVHADLHFAKGDAGSLKRRAVSRFRQPVQFAPLRAWTFRDPTGSTDPTGSGHNVIAKRELFELGFYPAAAIQYLSGQHAVSVYGTAGRYFFQDYEQFGAEDLGTLNMRLAGGAVATLSSGRIGWSSYVGLGPSHCQVVGTTGTLVIDVLRGAIAYYGAPRGASEPPFKQIGRNADLGLGTLLDDLVARIDDDLDGRAARRATIFPGQEGCAVVETLIAGYESIFSGSVIKV